MNGTLQTSQPGQSHIGGEAGWNLDPSPALRVTVIFTNREETLSALRTAGGLTKNLGAYLVLVVPAVIPFPLPLEKPPVPIDWLEMRFLALVGESGITADDVSIEIYLSRDRKQCLQRALDPRCLVVIGGRKRWWSRDERNLERLLVMLGHQVIFVKVEASRPSRPLEYPNRKPLLCRLLHKLVGRGAEK